MKLSVLSRHLPEPEGSASGRMLLAWVEGMVSSGHEIDVTSWGPEPPAAALPVWSTWAPLPGVSRLVMKARALVEPRADVKRLGWAPQPGARAVADDPVSFPGVERFPGAVTTFHYLTRFDGRAGRGIEVRDVQDLRLERHAARRASTVLAYSDRVAAAVGHDSVVVPAALRVPASARPPVDEPIAGVIARWGWPPNRAMLRLLLAAWPSVRDRVPGARLLLAGRELADDAGTGLPGVEVVGEVPAAADFLSRLGLMAFPCPPSSGPKVKVLEAMAHGVPVLTTEWGVEGIALGSTYGGGVAEPHAFASRLAALLANPAERARLGAAARAAVFVHHAPAAAAAARAAVLDQP
ncbi:MAG: glycosyltransferase [Acidimicrobiales bacterium]|nr:glycosyltransferase [Acidimicrobiales bacterium]